MQYDVFNGDADGICALHQLRLAEPVTANELVTGVKRDIALLRRVTVDAGDHVCALDISLDKNRTDLESILERGADVLYIDHHYAGEIPEHPRLETMINTASDVCTGLLVNGRLGGRFRSWAVVAAFGDNLDESARREARPLELNEQQLQALKELGVCINYNAYGVTPEDLHFHPADLFRRLQPYEDPFRFMDEDDTFERLREGYSEDMAKARALNAETATEHTAVFVLPDAAWSRRVSGVFGNELAQDFPQRAHALLTPKDGGEFVVSVRAPLDRKEGADELCRTFPTGGGRKAAAGINDLPPDQFDNFVHRFQAMYEGS